MGWKRKIFKYSLLAYNKNNSMWHGDVIYVVDSAMNRQNTVYNVKSCDNDVCVYN